MKTSRLFILCCMLMLVCPGNVFCENPSKSPDILNGNSGLTVAQVLDHVEKRYDVSGFSARFDQESTLKALQIIDTAEGNVFFKRPSKMRWVYEKPYRQQIISDGETLWIYRPDENQVTLGQSPSFFGDGKGASFLADIKLIREKFIAELDHRGSDTYYRLKLQPKEKIPDVSEIYLSVTKDTFDVVRVVTCNPYGDKTLIKFSGIEFKQDLDDSQFVFEVPEGTDILTFDQ